MTSHESPYDRVSKLPRQFKPLVKYDKECRRGLVHTPEYDQQMTALKDQFRQWVTSE